MKVGLATLLEATAPRPDSSFWSTQLNRLFLFAALMTCTAPAQATIQRAANPAADGTEMFVRVTDTPLVFTRQIYAHSLKGDARAQANDALSALSAALKVAGSDLTRLVRLTAYVSDDTAVSPVEAAVGAHFSTTPVALTLVRTALTQEGALVAFEGVAEGTSHDSGVERLKTGTAILPRGGKVFVSGEAQEETDLDSSVRMTMDLLFRALAHLGLSPADVVQVKAFVRLFSAHTLVERRIAASFPTDIAPPPPVVLMEWNGEPPVEIEVVAAAKSHAKASSAAGLPGPSVSPVSYTFLPWLPRLPVFCHVTEVASGTPLIFIGAIHGLDTDEPRAQMKTLFERLGSTLFEAGSSYRSLVKATYYYAEPATKAVLDKLRGVYFDPARAPAASAARAVSGLGHHGRAAAIDMIAVPAGG